MSKRAAIYSRVSTNDQTVENQVMELEKVASNHGWEIVEYFSDEGISGKNGREKRPALDSLLKGVARKQFDVVMAWDVSRLGRSLQHLVEFMEELRAKDIDLYLHQQGLDTSTPSGRAMYQMCGVFAEFEREMISERVKAGLVRAKAKGKKLGRRPISTEKEQEILDLRSTGMGMLKIAKQVGVGSGTVQRVLREG